VQPAASLPTRFAGRDTLIVEINPEATPLSGCATIVLRGTAAAILPRLLPGAEQNAARG
jgi:NAD-dependent deacetylase